MRNSNRWMAGAGLACVCLGVLAIGLGCEDVKTTGIIEVSPNNIQISSEEGAVVFVANDRSDLGAQSSPTAGFTGSPAVARPGSSGSFSSANSITNTTLLLPLRWSVTDPSLGAIARSEGLTAVYVPHRNTRGNQQIIVRDQGDARGVASIVQVPRTEEAPSVSAAPSGTAATP